MPASLNPTRFLPPRSSGRPFLAACLALAGLSSARADYLIENNAVITVPGNFGSGWQPGTLIVGLDTNGTLRINGAVVGSSTSSVTVAQNSTAVGLVEVNSGGLWNTKFVLIGKSGQGTVKLDNSSLVAAEGITLGQASVGTGTLTLSNNASVSAPQMIVGSNQGSGFLTITSSRVTLQSLTVASGISSDGTLSLSGSGASLSVSGGFSTGDGGGTAIVTVAGGATVNSGSLEASPSATTSSLSRFTVTDAGTQWTNAGAFVLSGVDDGGENSSLAVKAGALFSTQSATIGGTWGTASVLVTGANSRMNVGGNLHVGPSNAANITVESGGSLSAANTYLGSGSIGGLVSSLSVAGANSRMTSSSSLSVGYQNGGLLTIGDGAVVTSPLVRLSVDVGNTNRGTGNIVINGTSSGRGVLETGQIEMTEQRGAVTLNGGILRASASNTSFLTGFNSSGGSNGAITVGGQGGYIDSNGYDIRIPTKIDGFGALTKQGDGTLTLVGSQSYSGDTFVNGGTLVLEGGVLASSTVNIGSNGVLALSNSPNFEAFGTVVTGAGGFYIAAGSLVLTHDATHTGGTAIYFGSTLQVGNGGDSGSITGDVLTYGTFLVNRSNTSSEMVLGSVAGIGSFQMAGGNVTLGSSSGGLTGGIELQGGTLTLGNASAIATNTALKFTGGTLRYTSAGANDISAKFSQVDNQQFRFDTNGQNILLGSALKSAGGTLAKLGAGTLTLVGNSTYTGATTISQGTLQIGNGGTTGALAGDVVNNGTLVFNRSTDSSYSGVLGGIGNVVKLGSGTLNLTATGGSSGALNVNGGTLVIGNGNTYANSVTSGIGDLPGVAAAITVTGANSRWLNSSDLYVGNLGNGALNVSSGGLVRDTFALLGRPGGSGTANVSGAGSRWENSQGLVVGFAGAGFLNISGGGLVSNAESVIGGDGAGTVVVTGTGSQWVSSADMTLGLRANALLTVGAGATVTVGGGTGLITLGSAGTSGGILVIGESNGATGDANGDTIKAGEITGGAGTGFKFVSFNTSSSISFKPKLTGALGVLLNGTGTITLDAPSTYTGGTSINQGTLASTVSGALSSRSALTLANAANAVLSIGTTSQTIGSLNGGGSTGGSVTMATGGSLALGGDNSTATFSGAIKGSAGGQLASIAKKGSGTFTLGGVADNTNLGGSVDSGTLVLNKASSSTVHAIGRDFAVAGGATLRLAGTGGDQIVKSASLTVNSGGTLDLNGRSEGFQSLLGAGSVTNTAASTTAILTLGENDGSGTFSGILSDGPSAAQLALVKVGTGTVTLGGGNTNTGGVAINAGKLVAARNGEFGTFAAGSTVTVNAGGTLQANGSDALGWGNGNAKLVVNGGTVTTDGTPGQHTTLQNVTMTGGHLTDSGGNGQYFLNGPLVTNASATSAVIDAAQFELGNGWTPGTTALTVADGAAAIDLDLASSLVGSGPLVKNGVGTLRLTGTSTYTGATSVNAGKLLVNGSITSATTINSGGTLGGSGTVGAITLASGGTISPGNSPGTLSTGAETWNGGAGYVWELNNASAAPGAKGVTYDWLNITGTLDLAATSGSKFTISVTSLTAGNTAGITPGFVIGQTYRYTIATASGGISGFSPDKFLIDTSAFLNDPENLGGFAIWQSLDGNSLVLDYTAVPEPPAVGLGLGLLCGLVLLTRRRRQQPHKAASVA